MSENNPVPLPEEPPFADATQPPLPAPEPDADGDSLVSEAKNLGGVINTQPLNVSPLAEAPCSFHTVLYRPTNDGDHWVTITVRGEDPINTLFHFEEVMNTVEENGWKPNSGFRPPVGAPATPVEPKSGYPIDPQSNEAAGVAPQPNKSDSGTDVLHKVIVVPTQKGIKVEFYVGRFNYPMSDSRSSDVIASIFDPALKWQKEHFETPRSFDLTNYNYMADWEKVVKPGVKGKTATYYNVVRVHKA